MCTCRSKTYNCGFIEPPVPISCLFYLSLKIQMTFARVCYCDFSTVTHHVTILKSKDRYAFYLSVKTLLSKNDTFFTDEIFLITEVLLLIDSKRQKFLPVKSYAHQVFTDEVFIFFFLFFIPGRKPYQRINSSR